MSQPTILVDMDGPVCDFDTQFWNTCEHNGWHLDCDRTEQQHRFATDHIIDPDHRRAARNLVDTSRWFLQLPETPGALDGLRHLADHADVWLCTKPLEANRHCRDDKASWIRARLGDDWERRLIITPDKSLVHGDVLLDDAPKTAWLARASWTPVIYPTSWNGPGSEWAGLQRWKWGDPIDIILAAAAVARRTAAS